VFRTLSIKTHSQLQLKIEETTAAFCAQVESLSVSQATPSEHPSAYLPTLIETHSKLLQDPGERTTALLHTFVEEFSKPQLHLGGEATTPLPQLSQWSGPPPPIIPLQVKLYAGLTLSLLLPCFLVYVKKWSYLYPLTIVQESTIEQSQRKPNNSIAQDLLDIIGYLILVALLLVGCYIHVTLWRDGPTLSPALAVISHITISYLYLLAVGAAYKGSPHHVPGVHILCSVASAVASTTLAVALTFGCVSRHSKTANMFQSKVEHFWTSQPINGVTSLLVDILSELPGMLASDISYFGQIITQSLMAFGHQVYTKLLGVLCSLDESDQDPILGPTHVLRVLQSSPDNDACLATLKFLAGLAVLDDLDPTLVAECFNVVSSCVSVFDNIVTVAQGLEELATVSATCLLQTYSHLSVMDPKSGVLGDVHQHYHTVFPPGVDFGGFPFYYTLGTIHKLFNSDQRHQQHGRIEWQDYKPPSNEHAVFASSLTKLALSEYQRREGQKKVPRWILQFVLHSISLDPSPPTPVIVECYQSLELTWVVISKGPKQSWIRGMFTPNRC